MGGPRGVTGTRGVPGDEFGRPGLRAGGARGWADGSEYGRPGLRGSLGSGELSNGSAAAEERFGARRAALLGEDPYAPRFGGMPEGAGALSAEELAGARGGAMMPFGGAGRRGQGDDEEEHGMPDYLQETSSIWGGDQTAAPSVIGE